MAEIKALEELREWGRQFGPMGSHDPLMFADRIQAEVDGRFMELPTDADGVPVRPGEELWDKFTGEHVEAEHVYAVSSTHVYIWEEGPNKAHGIFGSYPEHYVHAKPRTVEDVLADRANDVLGMVGSGLFSLETALNDAFGGECADEIRELMKETEE